MCVDRSRPLSRARHSGTPPLRDRWRPGGTLLIVVAAFWFAAPSAMAQVGGVYVDAKGVLRDASTLDDSERLKRIASELRAATEDADVSASSKARKVSLRRLEAEVSQRRRDGKPLSAEALQLAGLTQLTHLLFDPADEDVILVGPAEGWTIAPSGEIVGVRSRRPTLQLDDLIHALRFSLGEAPAAPFIGVSIEPTPEGMQRYAAFLKSRGGQMDRSRLAQIFGGMEQAMGAQAVKLYGVPASSRFALKLAAADYRLKRLALGHDASPVPEVINYMDLHAKRLNPSAPQRQHRWWFVAEYDALRHTADGLAWEFEGQGVKVATAPTGTGNAASGTEKAEKSKAGKEPAAPSATQFAQLATRHFPKLAERIPVFAELQNLIALSVAAELIAERKRSGGSERNTKTPREQALFAHFLDDKNCPTEEATVPESVPSMTSYRLVDNRHWLISISGGVEISPRRAAAKDRRKEASPRSLQDVRNRSAAPRDSARWWWD